MAESVEIPFLVDPYLMELSVCGRLRTRNSRLLGRLKALAKEPMMASVGDDLYVQVFSGGSVKNHLHVNIINRPPEFAKSRARPLRPLSKVEKAIGAFAGTAIDLDIRGEFFIRITELPERGIIRSAMGEKESAGLRVRQKAQTLSIANSAVRELSWSLSSSEKYVTIGLEVNERMEIGSDYLIDCEIIVTSAFRALIAPENTNVATQ